jgi:hypothetical protein
VKNSTDYSIRINNCIFATFHKLFCQLMGHLRQKYYSCVNTLHEIQKEALFTIAGTNKNNVRRKRRVFALVLYSCLKQNAFGVKKDGLKTHFLGFVSESHEQSHLFSPPSVSVYCLHIPCGLHRVSRDTLLHSPHKGNPTVRWDFLVHRDHAVDKVDRRLLQWSGCPRREPRAR